MNSKNRNQAFRDVNVLHPSRSLFDLSHERVLTCDMGQLIPVMNLDCVPGDKFKIGTDLLVRFQPLLAPIMHPVNAYIHTFFVPYRLLWAKSWDYQNNDTGWETFISGGPTGNDQQIIPTWNPAVANTKPGSLWDYFGFPTYDPNGISGESVSSYYGEGVPPVDFLRRAYYFIYDEYYRDETLQAPLIGIQELSQSGASQDPGSILHRNWKKDYLTSSLPFQQRGTAPAFPISGHSSAIWGNDAFDYQATIGGGIGISTTGGPEVLIGGSNNQTLTNRAKNAFNNNTVPFDGKLSFDVADLRYTVQLQRWLERNARSGVRYTEFLRSHFGVSPSDSRLQRPEYIGGIKCPVTVSEVLQTSQTASQQTPLATMGGHGISAEQGFQGEYFVQEYGVILSILSVMPEAVYSQGIDREWTRRSRYDFYFREFADLSEQAVHGKELYCSNDNHNEDIFGYQGRYDEYRQQKSKLHGLMKTDLKFWNLGRIFATRPALNSTFISMDSAHDDLKRIFAVPSQPGLIVHVGNRVRAVRPMPDIATPGNVDHN